MKRIKKFLSSLGPGFITGASDDDPSGIGTYSQTGAQFGFSQAWAAVFTFPLMSVVQEMCGRIGLVTGKGLAGVIKEHYSQKLLVFAVVLLLIANTINIGANLGAMAASARMIIPLPFTFWLILMVVITLILEVFISYKTYASYLKYLTFSLFAYVFTVFVVKVPWGDVFVSTVIPRIEVSRDFVMNLVAIFGTTISPYLFFWQATEEVEEEIAHHKLRQMGKGVPKITPKDITNLRIDTITGMLMSNIVMWFIIVTTGATLYANGIHSIESASQAAEALRPIAGDFAFILFAVGIIGTGLLAVPVLAGSASYAVAEMLDWKAGLYLKLQKAHGFYGVITIATLLGLLVNYIGVNSIQMLYYTAVVNGIIAPPLIFIILFIANNKKIMREHINNDFSNYLGIFVGMLMSIFALLLLYFTFFS